MPARVRTDNGEPFGVPTRDVIPVMSLWLEAWGITPILNRPRHPQGNAHVENNQRTASRWAEVKQCRTVIELQAALDEACRIQRDIYPVKRIGSVPRKKVFPQLYQNTRLFEQARFDEQKAYEFLAQAIYPRKVSANGSIMLYGQTFQVGLKFRRQILFLKFDPSGLAWLCFNENNDIVKTLPDERFTRQNLYELKLCQ